MRAFATSWVKADILQMCRSLVDNCGLAAPFQGFEQYVLTRTSENMAPGRLIHRVRAYVATTCVANDSSPTPLGRSSSPPRRSPTGQEDPFPRPGPNGGCRFGQDGVSRRPRHASMMSARPLSPTITD